MHVNVFSTGLIAVTQPIFALFLSQIYGLFPQSNLEKQQRLTLIRHVFKENFFTIF
jgi:hypothetical protein